ncbi:MAG: hypothetical protein D3918_00345 [Candidatus Electrothrix sp. AX2]|nr:hypothetical protein [Candidatus Electrothrix gigas]MCI5225122.1 hypothetical protein [Candidatus Electrothrix gigas]
MVFNVFADNLLTSKQNNRGNYFFVQKRVVTFDYIVFFNKISFFLVLNKKEILFFYIRQGIKNCIKK